MATSQKFIGILSGNQSLNPNIEERILTLAGRQATAAYQIASGGTSEHAKPHIQRSLFSEPFHYADWHNVTEDEWAGTEFASPKRWLLQECERSLINVDELSGNPPCPLNRWETFTEALKKDVGKRCLVKRIALPHQGFRQWVSKDLTELEALDLGALREDGDWGKHNQFKEEDQGWDMILNDSEMVARTRLGPEELESFTWLSEGSPRKEALLRRLAGIEEARKKAWALYYKEKRGSFGSLKDLSSEFQDLGKEDPRIILASAEAAYQKTLQLIIANQRTYDISHAKEDPLYTPPQTLLTLMISLETTLFTNLTWLGIRDWRNGSTNTKNKIIDVVLPRCKNLKTLSIRGEYAPDPHIHLGDYCKEYSEPFGCAHTIVCDFILRIANRIPDTVTTLELRLNLPLPSYFLKKLHELAPSVQRVGIDLGAWVQVFPLRTRTGYKSPKFCKSSTNQDMQKNVEAATSQARFDAFKTAHEDLRVDGQLNHTPNVVSWVPPLNPHLSPYEAPKDDFNWGNEFPERKPRKAIEKSFWRDEIRDGRAEHPDRWDAPGIIACKLDREEHLATAQLLDQEKTKTLPQMLKKLYDCRHKDQGGEQDIRLFALEPEAWKHSTTPVHPLALLQTVDEAGGDVGKTYGGMNPDKDMGEVYKWLDQVFQWRPVFDWDWFMVPDKMQDTLDMVYARILAESATEHYTATEAILKRICTHFNLLKESGIPVHLLIGRRSEEKSSCYWGWPYDEKNWQEWLDKDFDANLLDIAPVVDTLSILYDLRNPVDEEKLEEIDALNLHIRPSATCPSVLCPWREDGVCFFHIQRELQGHASRKSPSDQRMASKQALRHNKSQRQTPDGYDRLANGSLSAPPVGENANGHPSDDSDSEDTPLTAVGHARPHHLARRAVYTREAVGFQRFWSTYALHFTSLSCLRICMPRCFDKPGSWRLAKLLDQRQGWQMSIYTDERQHVQTAEDILGSLPAGFKHEAQRKVWPAGRFVRRTWVWPQIDVHWKPLSAGGDHDLTREDLEAPHFPPRVIEKLELVATNNNNWKKRAFTDEDWSETRTHEAQEFLEAKAAASISQEALAAYYLLPSSASKLSAFYRSKADEARQPTRKVKETKPPSKSALEPELVIVPTSDPEAPAAVPANEKPATVTLAKRKFGTKRKSRKPLASEAEGPKKKKQKSAVAIPSPSSTPASTYDEVKPKPAKPVKEKKLEDPEDPKAAKTRKTKAAVSSPEPSPPPSTISASEPEFRSAGAQKQTGDKPKGDKLAKGRKGEKEKRGRKRRRKRS